MAENLDRLNDRPFASSFFLTVGLAIVCIFNAVEATAAHAEENVRQWKIENTIGGVAYDTATKQIKLRGLEMPGLLSVRKRGGKILTMQWQPGAYKPTINYNGMVLVDGFDLDDKARLSSLRLGRNGSLVFLKSADRTAPVSLIQDNQKLHQWPARSKIKLWEFNAKGLLYSQKIPQSSEVVFSRMKVTTQGKIVPQDLRQIGTVKGCEILSARTWDNGILIEAICSPQNNATLYHLTAEDRLTPLFQDQREVFFANGLLSKQPVKRQRGEFGLLKVSGSSDGLHFYHALNGAFLSNLGEPASFASDEAGKQSWTQSYRTRALAMLYAKTGHEAFARLAIQAMENTRASQNGFLKIKGSKNPSCGWTSRAYSKDGKTPLSLLVNQAMVSGGLIKSCTALGQQCGAKRQEAIDKDAICLAQNFEKNFDAKTNLYRIHKNVPFRNDGIWAPWNWQTNWAIVLRHAGKRTSNAQWTQRADSLIQSFVDSFESNHTGALWRYWPPAYYQGWKRRDEISSNRAKFTPSEDERFEDINHGGISLMAACDLDVKGKWRKAARQRLQFILEQGIAPSRDLDGRGPRSSRYFPSLGWDCLGDTKLREFFTKRLVGAKGAPKFLTYTRMYRPQKPFNLSLELSRCTLHSCKSERVWKFKSAADYLEKSPFFKITPLTTHSQ